MDKLLWNKKGFTLGEVVTVTAIIGTLTAIALPNFLRVKMNVNMEMVKQHLRVIGQEMGELMNQDPLHQFPANLNFDDPMSAGEFTITASLSGIDSKGYTSDGYSTQANRSTYMLRTCPKEGLFGIAGDRCFLLDPSGIREIDPWDADGVVMAVWVNQSFGDPGQILANSNMTQNEKAKLLANLFEYLAFDDLKNQLGWQEVAPGDPLLERTSASVIPMSGSMSPDTYEYMTADEIKSAYENLLPKVYELLAERGITISGKTEHVESLISGRQFFGTWNGDPRLYASGPGEGSSLSDIDGSQWPVTSGDYLQIGFQFSDEYTIESANAKRAEAQQKIAGTPLDWCYGQDFCSY